MTINDRMAGIAGLLLAAFLAIFGWGLQAPFAYEPVGPRAFPLGLSLVIALCSGWLVYKGGGEAEPNPPGANLRISLMVGLIAAYAFLFVWLGFVIANTIMVVFVGGSWVKSVITGVVMSVLFFLLFDKVLDVVLPTGLLGGLL